MRRNERAFLLRSAHCSKEGDHDHAPRVPVHGRRRGRLSAFREDGLAAGLAAVARRRGRSPEEIAERRGLLARDPAGLHGRPRLHQPQQRRGLALAARGPGRDEALPRPLQRGPRLHHVAAPGAADRVGAPRPGPRLRLRSRGDGHHPERQRVAGDLPARPRPEAGRRGPDHEPGLPADDHHLAAARAPRRDRAEDDLLPRAPALHGRTSSTASRGPSPPRTRVIHFCHITNLTGQIFP